MGEIIYESPRVQGEITLDLSLFPKEVIQDMVDHPGQLPLLDIVLEKIYMTDSIQIAADYTGSKVTLTFGANDIKIKPA